jgi:hypothetical protein
MTGKSSATAPESEAAVPGAREAFASWRTRAGLRLAGIDLGGLGVRVLGSVWVRVPAIACGVAAAIPVIASTVRAVRAGWVPAGDDGVIATRGWDVLTSHTPLVGQYSEAGLVVHGQLMHSPGPLLYWLIALPARFGSVTSIAVTMGVVNSLAIVGCVVLARRRGGVVLMFATAVGIALMCQSLPSEAMHDIWNPAAGLFPFLLLVFVCWSLACGEYRLLPVTVLIAHAYALPDRSITFVIDHVAGSLPASSPHMAAGGGVVSPAINCRPRDVGRCRWRGRTSAAAGARAGADRDDHEAARVLAHDWAAQLAAVRPSRTSAKAAASPIGILRIGMRRHLMTARALTKMA